MANNKSEKRVRLDKDKSQLFIIVSVAAVITVGSIVVARALWSQGNYLQKVAGIKTDAKQQLEENKAAVASLTEAYGTFINQDPNLLGGRKDGDTDRDGDNGVLVLDALPSSYDFPAVASSLEKLLAGYSINSIAGTDDSAAQATLAGGVPVEIPFMLSVRANYEGFKELSGRFNRSIRPIHITSLELSGSNSELDIDILGKTFYQSEHGLQITEEQVP